MLVVFSILVCSCCSNEKWTDIPGVILKDQQVHPISSMIAAKKKTMRQKNDAPKFGGYTS